MAWGDRNSVVSVERLLLGCENFRVWDLCFSVLGGLGGCGEPACMDPEQCTRAVFVFVVLDGDDFSGVPMVVKVAVVDFVRCRWERE